METMDDIKRAYELLLAENATLRAKADLVSELLQALARLSAQAALLRLSGQLVTDAEKVALAAIAKATGDTE